MVKAVGPLPAFAVDWDERTAGLVVVTGTHGSSGPRTNEECTASQLEELRVSVNQDLQGYSPCYL